MKKLSRSFLCILLVVCLLPLYALAEGYDTEPLYRSTFRFALHMNADAFPNDGAAHYADWQKLFERFSFAGTIDYQRPTEFMDQYVRMDANIMLNGEAVFPFQYESYGVSRFLHTAAMGEDYLYFNMINFWQFMLKPFYFMGLPTNLLSMLIAWDMTAYVAKDFVAMVQKCLGGKTELGHRKLKVVANRISRAVVNKRYNLYYSFLQGFLGLIYGDYLVYDDITRLSKILYTYPSIKDGMKITTEGGITSYRLGDLEVLRIEGDDWSFRMPDDQGYVFEMEKKQDEDQLSFAVKATRDDEVRLDAFFLITGLKQDENLCNEGDILLKAHGGALADNLPQESYEAQFHYRHERSAESLPRSETFTLDWIHPTSGKAALGCRYEAIIEEADVADIRNDRKSHKVMTDFFSMNGDILAEMKEKYLKPVAVSLIPLAMDVPLGVYSDVFAFLKETGFLAMLGIEGL